MRCNASATLGRCVIVAHRASSSFFWLLATLVFGAVICWLAYFIAAALVTGEMVVDSASYPSGKAILTARNEPWEFAYQVFKRLVVLLIAAGYFYVRGQI